MNERPDLTTAAGFLSERRDFLYVSVVPSASGDGFDVVVRVDGTYSELAEAEDAALGIRRWIESLTDVDATGRVWWAGPPFEPQPRPRALRILD